MLLVSCMKSLKGCSGGEVEVKNWSYSQFKIRKAFHRSAVVIFLFFISIFTFVLRQIASERQTPQ